MEGGRELLHLQRARPVHFRPGLGLLGCRLRSRHMEAGLLRRLVSWESRRGCARRLLLLRVGSIAERCLGLDFPLGSGGRSLVFFGPWKCQFCVAGSD
jgi:hypothetical protein